MKSYIEERAIQIGLFVVENGATVRQTARRFGISKSTVHKDVTYNLKKINPESFLSRFICFLWCFECFYIIIPQMKTARQAQIATVKSPLLNTDKRIATAVPASAV